MRFLVDNSGCVKRRRTILLTLLMLLWIAPLSAYARCDYVAGTGPLTLRAVLQGSITVGRDVPLGTELYRTHAQSTSLVAVLCTATTRFNYRYIALPYPKASYVDPVYGNNVYLTNVPGVGVVGWAGNQPMPVSFNEPPLNTVYNVPFHDYYFSLIKIGDVSPGTIIAGSLPINEYVVGNNNLRVHLGGAVGSLNIVASTCTTPDVNVPMGNDHLLTELTGVGSTTSPAVDASFRLLNCPAFFGRTSVVISNGNVGNAPALGANAISFRIDPTTRVVDAANGVFALRPGGATGIGIQLLDGANAPVALQATSPAGLVLQPTSMNYTVPLSARYYQTDPIPTAGAANSSVTVTLTYL